MGIPGKTLYAGRPDRDRTGPAVSHRAPDGNPGRRRRGNAESSLFGLIGREYDVIAALEGGRSVSQKAEELHPDVIILDISMPDMNGLEVARALRRSVPDIP